MSNVLREMSMHTTNRTDSGKNLLNKLVIVGVYTQKSYSTQLHTHLIIWFSQFLDPKASVVALKIGGGS